MRHPRINAQHREEPKTSLCQWVSSRLIISNKKNAWIVNITHHTYPLTHSTQECVILYSFLHFFKLNSLSCAVLHLHHRSIHWWIHTHIPTHIHRCMYKHKHTYTLYTYNWVINVPLGGSIHRKTFTSLQNLTDAYCPF